MRGFFEIEPVKAGAPASLLVLGGSQGSAVLNRHVPRALGRLLERRGESGTSQPLRVVHQCGKKHLEQTLNNYQEALSPELARELPQLGANSAAVPSVQVSLPGLELEITRFVDDVAASMAQCTLVVSRSGAITSAEIAAAGRAALFIPLTLAGAHQRENARVLETVGAAQRIEEETLGRDQNALAERLETLLGDTALLAEMGEKARALGHPGAPRAIANQFERLTGGAS